MASSSPIFPFRVRVTKSLFRLWIPLGLAFLVGTLSVGMAVGRTEKIQGSLKVTKTVKAKKAKITQGLTAGGTLIAGEFQYGAPQTILYVIPAAAFTATQNDAAGVEITTNEVNIAGDYEAVAPVALPDGAVVTKMEAFFNGGDGDVTLRSNVQTSAAATVMASVSIPVPCTPTCSASGTSINDSTIDNDTKYYGVEYDVASAGGLFAVVLTYTTTDVGPASG